MGRTLDVAIESLGRHQGVEKCSEWVIVDQSMIDRFADVTGDYEFIHVDPVRAANDPIGGTIAHGLVSLSLLPALIKAAGRIEVMGAELRLNYSLDRVRFLAPVREGKIIRLRYVLAGLEKRGSDQIQIELDVRVDIEGEARPALVARWLQRIFAGSA